MGKDSFNIGLFSDKRYRKDCTTLKFCKQQAVGFANVPDNNVEETTDFKMGCLLGVAIVGWHVGPRFCQ